MMAKKAKYPIENFSEDEKEYFDERAGIMEFDGEKTRKEAEKEALKVIIQKRKDQQMCLKSCCRNHFFDEKKQCHVCGKVSENVVCGICSECEEEQELKEIEMEIEMEGQSE